MDDTGTSILFLKIKVEQTGKIEKIKKQTHSLLDVPMSPSNFTLKNL